ncbi:class I SAM-dependent methyltransferase [Stenotrophomonas rhizophila]|uniref:class I SAM-dependent methyltransferase n=1 Tax=Stenotrophomonas rhizophila TaxID=216778 RepID=UPI001E34772D|nr:class I SAM-dependent methyltransferase [Stenotrophomonas rhizophila]MCC7633915.1 class I SAM-dependent methyltransferase [Stenotrophomonas rhizophila]MCC7663249.1 class I SAM-dependent methyltransferase [Stenotrophomonas rhizophila]
MTDNAQHALWNGLAGQAWVQAQSLLDGMFAPFARLLAQAQPAGAVQQVLDIGCGTGAVSLAIAARLGSGGHCTGVDIAAAMIERARQRARDAGLEVDFVVADAQRHAFAPASVDRIVSRFGVMFFDDPVQAFTRLRHATRHGGSLHALTWRSAAENAFMTTAERAAAPMLTLPARDPDAPGQFAFADPDRVRAILTDSGWTELQLTAIDVPCQIPRRDLRTYISLLGPVGSALRSADIDAATRARVLAAVEQAFAPFVEGDSVRFTAACWEVRASAG